MTLFPHRRAGPGQFRQAAQPRPARRWEEGNDARQPRPPPADWLNMSERVTRTIVTGVARTAVPLARHLLRARDLMDRAYAEPLDVPALARRAGVSRAHFTRSFKHTFGETPHQYLMSRRMERAKSLLRAGDLSVTEVCFAVGFSSLGSFSTQFRRFVGE